MYSSGHVPIYPRLSISFKSTSPLPPVSLNLAYTLLIACVGVAAGVDEVGTGVDEVGAGVDVAVPGVSVADSVTEGVDDTSLCPEDNSSPDEISPDSPGDELSPGPDVSEISDSEESPLCDPETSSDKSEDSGVLFEHPALNNIMLNNTKTNTDNSFFISFSLHTFIFTILQSIK